MDVFWQVPDNRELPDDIHFIKTQSIKQKRYFAPSISVLDRDISKTDWYIEDVIEKRELKAGQDCYIVLIAWNNAQRIIENRIARLYYVEEDFAEVVSKWKSVQTISGKEYVSMSSALPEEYSRSNESFILKLPDDKPYYLIARMEAKEKKLTFLQKEKVNLNDLNESYYWCILNSKKLYSIY